MTKKDRLYCDAIDAKPIDIDWAEAGNVDWDVGVRSKLSRLGELQ